VIPLRARIGSRVLAITLCAGLAGACSDTEDSPDIAPDDSRVEQCDDVLILTAMPSELAPLLDAVDVIDTFQLNDRLIYSAKRGEHRLLLAMTGIGLVNAEQATTLALANFPVRALLYSGVAGSTHRIADVVVADGWLLSDSSEIRAVDEQLLQTARTIAEVPLPFQRCTPYPLDPPGATVCLDHEPQLILGGIGRSADPFGGDRLACRPDGGDIFGCAPANAPTGEPVVLVPTGGSSAQPMVVQDNGGDTGARQVVQIQDMESAMALEVARGFNVPAIAVRSVSDGSGDPLALTGLYEQFFAYYRLAAGNAALVTLALYDRVVAECDL